MNNEKKYVGKIVWWVLLIVVCIPIFIGIKYCVPKADDFDFTNSLISHRVQGGSDFAAAWEVGKQTYMIWQGAYFSNITNALFSPFYRGGIKGYHLELAALTVLFVFSIVYSVCNALKKYTKDFNTNIVAIISIVILVGATIRAELPQIFYWNCGALAYLLPLSMGVIACSFVGFSKVKTGWIGWIQIAGFSLISFLSVGATLIISAAISGFMVLSVCLKFLENKKLDKTMFVALMAIIGSFVNAVAPGNFARQSVKDGSVTIFDAIWFAIDYLIDSYYELLRNGSLVILAVVLFLLLWKRLDVEKFKFKYPVIVTIWMLIVSFLGIFPVVYGYKSKSTADRTDFTEEFIIIYVLITIIVYWMGWAKTKIEDKLPQDTRLASVVLLIAMICLYCNTYNTEDINYIRITRHFLDGGMKEYFVSNMDVYNEIESADTPNVVLEICQPDTMGVYEDVYFSDDPYHWINSAVAKYYGKETLSVIYCNPE